MDGGDERKMKQEEWRNEFAGRKILIWGFGREGRSSLLWIRTVCPGLPLDIADGTITESLKSEVQSYGNVRLLAQDNVDFSSYDMILKAPGIPVPTSFDRSNLTQQTHLFLKHHGFQTIGITGTKGKSTTTSLVHTVLSQQYTCHLIGNIGIPCFDILPVLEETDLCAFEISCHQLEDCPYSPHTAVFLNLYQEHLDHYADYQAYGNAKANIFRHQKPGETAILNQELFCAEERTDALLIGRDIRAEGHLLIAGSHMLEVTDCSLIGAHNYLNLAVVLAVADRYGIREDAFRSAVSSFAPLHHRLEYIGEHNGIRFVNDSISTIGQAAIAALNSLPDTDVILIGGMDRGIDYADLEEVLKERKDLYIIFMYATGRRIMEELRNQGAVHDHMILKADLEEALACAKQYCRRGHIVLLSPAASSYDHFRNFEERGEIFARLALES